MMAGRCGGDPDGVLADPDVPGPPQDRVRLDRRWRDRAERRAELQQRAGVRAGARFCGYPQAVGLGGYRADQRPRGTAEAGAALGGHDVAVAEVVRYQRGHVAGELGQCGDGVAAEMGV